MTTTPTDGEADLLVTGAKLAATCDAERRELPGGWVAITGGLVSGVGASSDPAPVARETLDAAGCLITPGLVNTHHHMYQNLTRSYAPVVNGTLFEWLAGLYPLRRVPTSRPGSAWPSWHSAAAPPPPTISTSRQRPVVICGRPRSPPPARLGCGSTPLGDP